MTYSRFEYLMINILVQVIPNHFQINKLSFRTCIEIFDGGTSKKNFYHIFKESTK